MNSWELRQKFLLYFNACGHDVVPSASLIPAGDPTLLFTNAGMVPFKDVFLGVEKTDRKRAVSIQKCVRAGGKHNDLDRVGFTRRHHTFFEMMGNFSFGDYFKREAIEFAWKFLTREIGLSPDVLWVTVYKEDDEAERLWREVTGISQHRIVRLGEKDNVWQMGETGPCGPCSEILVDQGAGFSCGSPDCKVGCDCDRYLEIWNLVFMQYDRNSAGDLMPLPRPSIDTGMGLERLCAVVQGKDSNFETDLFMPLIRSVEGYARLPYGNGAGDLDYAYRVVADHLRSSVFLLHEGIAPSNEGRGHVLRRIIRRAILFGRELGLPYPVLPALAEQVALMMSRPYPELGTSLPRIQESLRMEEGRFHQTLESGLPILQEMIRTLEKKQEKVFPGEMLFLLHDTHGFPLDIAEDTARMRGILLDYKGYEEKMEEQRERGRSSWTGKKEDFPLPASRLSSPVEFRGYGKVSLQGSVVLLVRGQEELKEAREGEEIMVVLDKTVFYPEGGGQTGDVGDLIGPFGYIRVTGTRKPYPGWIVLTGEVRSGKIAVGETVDQHVDENARHSAERHHTATHLLHAALRTVLGDQVRQAGSLVSPEKLRFDFTYPHPVSHENLNAVEELVNRWILQDSEVDAREMEKSKALDMGALAFFDEKYGDRVRVVQVPGTSVELCGGTHVHHTGEIGSFLIVQETGVAAGIRRIEAVAGPLAYQRAVDWRQELKELRGLLEPGASSLSEKTLSLLKENAGLQKEIQTLRSRLFAIEEKHSKKEFLEQGGHKLAVVHLQMTDTREIRARMDAIKSGIDSGAVLLIGETEEKLTFLGWTSPDLGDVFPISLWVKTFATEVGGKGGGKPSWAEGGGLKPANVPSFVQNVKSRLEEAFTARFS
uniref:Alanine--tRNA ligase n=1 Tax=Leptospirillum ferriphilum TaxID=178606 RepID=A0A7C3LRQ2_9BACT